jgi:ATP-dependent Lon protease
MTIHQKNFIEFGMLPFVGRETILERILSFLTTTQQSETLQIALIQGEAGVGKTSFIKHITPILRRSYIDNRINGISFKQQKN